MHGPRASPDRPDPSRPGCAGHLRVRRWRFSQRSALAGAGYSGSRGSGGKAQAALHHSRNWNKWFFRPPRIRSGAGSAPRILTGTHPRLPDISVVYFVPETSFIQSRSSSLGGPEGSVGGGPWLDPASVKTEPFQAPHPLPRSTTAREPPSLGRRRESLGVAWHCSTLHNSLIMLDLCIQLWLGDGCRFISSATYLAMR